PGGPEEPDVDGRAQVRRRRADPRRVVQPRGHLVGVALLDVRQQVVEERAVVGAAKGAAHGRQAARLVVAVVQADRDLVDVVAALDPSRRLADLLDGGQQQPNQDGNDGDDDQQLNQREAFTTRRGRLRSPEPSPTFGRRTERLPGWSETPHERFLLQYGQR